jgi:F-type H+-transporting ATPase subunit epsilon
MPDTMLLQVVSPERLLVDEQVTEAQIPALDGYIGAMPGHAPLLSSLKAGGVLTYKAGGKDETLAVYGGFVQILPDRVRVLADSAQPGREINAEQARERLKQAQAELDKQGVVADEAARAEIERAQAAVDAAAK